MKIRTGLLALVALVSVCAAMAQTPAHERSTVLAAEDMKLVPLDLRHPDGPALAVLYGDPSTGPSAMLLRLPKGELPLHVHSSGYHLMVLRGTLKHWDAGDSAAAARPMGPGSYWFQPGGMAHGDACLSDDCLVYLTWLGKRDSYRPKP